MYLIIQVCNLVGDITYIAVGNNKSCFCVSVF